MGQVVIASDLVPPPLAVQPELTDEDVDWLNAHLALLDDPPVRYARHLPVPPPSSGAPCWAPR